MYDDTLCHAALFDHQIVEICFVCPRHNPAYFRLMQYNEFLKSALTYGHPLINYRVLKTNDEFKKFN